MKEAEGRRIEVFFYGLFMDESLLLEKGLRPASRRVARVEGFRLFIGARATLSPCEGCEVYGVLYSLKPSEVDALYSEETVRAYRPEAVCAQLPDGTAVPALCFNLPEPPDAHVRNPAYALKLRELAQRLGLPAEYVSSIN